MYYYVKGKLVFKGDSFVVVDVGGIGYQIFTSVSSIEKTGAVGSDVTMYTYLNVREDAMELYGFVTPEEKKLFLQLISVSSVGPKVAVAVLSIAPTNRIASAIITADTKFLTRASGVGPKAAQRIILELKDKIDTAELGIGEDMDISTDTEDETMITDSRAEAMSALVVLGYSANDAKSVLSKLDGTLPTEQLIKLALAMLM